MKKSLILFVVCSLTFATVYAQKSEAEILFQTTKTEQFLKNGSFIKEEQIFSCDGGGLLTGGLEILVKVFTDLKTGEQIAALEFWPQTLKKLAAALDVLSLGNEGTKTLIESREPLGYLDMEYVEDFVLALEKIQEEANNSSKKDIFSISYTAPGGIDIYFASGIKEGFLDPAKQQLLFRKKWYSTNEYGIKTNYSTSSGVLEVNALKKLIPAIKEAQAIAKQTLENN